MITPRFYFAQIAQDIKIFILFPIPITPQEPIWQPFAVLLKRGFFQLGLDLFWFPK